MNTQIINKIMTELKDFPDDKVSSLIDYVGFLKTKSKKKHKIPNETTLQTFKDTDEGKNLNQYNSFDEFLAEMDKE